jgi:hypothetical protein
MCLWCAAPQADRLTERGVPDGTAVRVDRAACVTCNHRTTILLCSNRRDEQAHVTTEARSACPTEHCNVSEPVNGIGDHMCRLETQADQYFYVSGYWISITPVRSSGEVGGWR